MSTSSTVPALDDGWWDALLTEIRQPLGRAVETVRARWDEIHPAWRRVVQRLALSREELKALSELRLDRGLDLRSCNFASYRLAMEHQGEDLARRGVPEEHALTALFRQLESALPHVIARGATAGRASAALVRLALVASLSLSAGYANARAAGRRSFDERERQRLSRDLHDEIGNHLVVLKLYLEMISRDLEGGQPGRIRRKLREATTLVAQAIESVRRLILDLGPAVIEEVGFLPAVKLYGRQFASRTGLRVLVKDEGLPRKLPAGYDIALYRVMQGALSNVVKHASASTVRIVLGGQPQSLVRMTIEDDGVGFDAGALRQAFGLGAMRERVESRGGRFHVESRPADRGASRHGTRLEIELPLLQDGAPA